MNYILKNGKPVPCEDVLEWARLHESTDRVVERTEVGNATVSTVFLGVDYNFGRGKAILFETMIFGGEFDMYQWRYATMGEAKQHHFAVVEALKTGVEIPEPGSR